MRSVAPIRREDVLRIMHDSRIGAFGAIALVVALALKWQTLAALPPMRAASLMIAAHAASRVFAISYLATLDYVRAEGKAKPVAQRLSGPALLCAAVFGLPLLLWPNGLDSPNWRFAVRDARRIDWHCALQWVAISSDALAVTPATASASRNRFSN